MPEEKLCPSCNVAVENGALFCGNCGYQLTAKSHPSSVAKVYSNGPATDNKQAYSPSLAASNMPAYAVPISHHKQHWAAMALSLGILGIGGGILIPILGIGLGIAGIVLVTMSFHLANKRLRIASLVVCVLAILVGIGFWVNAIASDTRLTASSNQPAATTNGTAKVSVQTPCYSLSFTEELNVNNSNGSCTLNAYNGTSLDDSSDVYKVIATATSLTTSSFTSFSKQAIEADFSKNLPGFTITGQAGTTFNGSPAYYIQANNKLDNAAVIEETVFHSSVLTPNGDNFFDIVHAVNGNSADLNTLQSGWNWND